MATEGGTAHAPTAAPAWPARGAPMTQAPAAQRGAGRMVRLSNTQRRPWRHSLSS
jgi:hypothetical protein